MDIVGLQKMTLLDFPGKVACTVFLHRCNFRCPFCHNSELIAGAAPQGMSETDFFTFLQKRQGVLDGVCVTGGEPTLQPALPDFLRRIKDLGYSVKLDTNGSRPELLAQLLEEELVDYVAMDIKNCPDRYAVTAGMDPGLLPKIEQSAKLLLTGSWEYEFRTTVVQEYHDAQSILAMGQWLQSLAPHKRVKRFFLQCFTDRESVLCAGLHAPTRDQMETFAQLLTPLALQTEIRGMD